MRHNMLLLLTGSRVFVPFPFPLDFGLVFFSGVTLGYFSHSLGRPLELHKASRLVSAVISDVMEALLTEWRQSSLPGPNTRPLPLTVRPAAYFLRSFPYQEPKLGG